MSTRPPAPPEPSGRDGEGSPSTSRPWAPLFNPHFRLLWISGLNSVTAEQGRRTVDLWLIYQLSGGSAVQLGLIGIFQALPLFTTGLLSGTIADLVDRKKLLLIAQAIRVAMLAGLGLVVLSGNAQVWHVYLATLLNGIAQVVEQPARTSLIPNMVPRTQLMHALGLNSSMRQLGMLTGPTIAAWLIGPIGVAGAYFTQAGLYVLSVGIMLGLPSWGASGAGGLRSLRVSTVLEGLKFMLSDRFLASVVVLDAMVVLFTSWRVLAPIVAAEVLGGDERTLGLLMAAPAAGRLVGTGMLMVTSVRRQGLLVLLVSIGYAASIAALGLVNHTGQAIVVMVLIGATDGAGSIVRNTVVQLAVPDTIRGRVTSVNQIFAQGSPALGQTVTGAMAAALGAPGALLVGGAIAIAVTMAVALRVREVVSFRV
ncbi:MAG: MFS transporter [Chloroflexota bacterium]